MIAPPRLAPPPDAADPAARWSAAQPMRLGLLAVAALLFGLGAWGAFASISGAVVASGRLKVESNRQVVQHPDGGVVAEILVEEGDAVEAGEVLIRLDDDQLRAELAIVEGQLFETLARIGRLEAEQIGGEAPRFDPELLAAAAERPEVAALVEGQRGLFLARRETAAREAEQLRERQSQIAEEIRGVEAQIVALEGQLGFIGKELGDMRSLFERGLAQAARVMALERENARLGGERGALLARIAEARGRSTEIDIQLIGREANRREEAISELRDLRQREAELRERRLALGQRIDRLALIAPRAGVVLGMTVFALRSVVRPAEPILYVVPSDEALVVEARIDPADVNQVYPGQPARLRFSAFNARTTPEIEASVKRVSPDALTDENTGASYYVVEIVIPKRGLAMLDGLTLVAGMPVDAFIQTGERSPLSYLARPLVDFFSRSMREE